MGCKNVKEHYRIEHIVHIRPEGLCVGSPYVSDIIVANLNGTIAKPYDRPNAMNNDWARYQREFETDPAKLRELIETPDTFTASIPVYTYDEDGNILAKLCEAPGWPNITHDGQLMYNNQFSTDRDEVVGWAKHNADIGIEWARARIAELQAELVKAEAQLLREIAAREKLEYE